MACNGILSPATKVQHNDLNIDGNYHIPKLPICHFSPY